MNSLFGFPSSRSVSREASARKTFPGADFHSRAKQRALRRFTLKGMIHIHESSHVHDRGRYRHD